MLAIFCSLMALLTCSSTNRFQQPEVSPKVCWAVLNAYHPKRI
jgi:hypothetical protein